MDNVIRVSLDDAKDSPVTTWRDCADSGRFSVSRGDLRFGVTTTTSTSGSTIVFSPAMDRFGFQIVGEMTIEDEIDLREALDALAEAREKGTITHAELKAELGLS